MPKYRISQGVGGGLGGGQTYVRVIDVPEGQHPPLNAERVHGNTDVHDWRLAKDELVVEGAADLNRALLADLERVSGEAPKAE